MIITVNKSELLNGITIAMRAVAAGGIMPILGCLLIETVDDCGIQIMGNNLELCIQTKGIEADITEGGSIALDARLLSEIVKKLPDGDISIAIDKKFIATIKSGKRKFTVLGQNGADFPAMPVLEKSKGFSMQSASLRNMLRQTVFAANIDAPKPALTGLLIEAEGGKINVAACDGFRIAYRYGKINAANTSFKVIIPAKSIGEIQRLLPSDNEYEMIAHFTDKQILFELEDCKISSRLIEGEFVNYQKMLNSESSTTAKINRAELLNSLECASIIALENSKRMPVTMELDEDKITITARAERGQLHEETEAIIDGDNLTIGFNPRFLIDALKAIDDTEIEIQFGDAQSPCIIKPITDGNFKYLVMPLKL